jgi:hypothetical protein
MDRLTRMLWPGCLLGLALALSGALEPAAHPPTLEAAIGGPATAATARLAERRRDEAVEAFTAACMRRAALPYTPWVPTAPIPDADLDPVAWAERWGFGISTSLDPSAGVQADPDPNRVYADTLPPGARARYDVALDGPAPGGCRRAANEGVRGLRDRLVAPLEDDLAAMRRAIAGDPAGFVAGQAWRRCVATAGIHGADRASTIPALMRGLATDLARLIASGPRTALTDLQDEERRLATAAARCEMAYASAMTAVRDVYERRFVAEHRTQLDRIREAVARSEAAWPALPPP